MGGSNPYPSSSFLRGFRTKEVAFLHKDSKTLVEADLLFNLPAKEQVTSSRLFPAFNRVFTTESVLEIQEDNIPYSH